MNVKQKEIILLPYPFTDLEGTKIRPAIVISNDSYNNKSTDCIAVPLTSVIKEMPYSIIISQEDLSSGKLIKPSRVKADKIFSVEKRLIMAKIGILKDSTFLKIKNEVNRVLW